MVVQVKVKKWGNSVGVVLPRELVKSQGIKEDQIITIDIIKEADFSDIFGSLDRFMTGQEFKDFVKK